MIDHIEAPVARATVRWTPPADGGRRTGPPTAPVYAAACVFPLGGDDEVLPGWPAPAECFSVLLEARGAVAETGEYDVGFLAPELAAPFVEVGASMLVMEGPKVVATAVVDVVYPDGFSG